MTDGTERLTGSWKEHSRFDGEVLPFGQKIDLDPRKVLVQINLLRIAIEDGQMPPVSASTSLLDYTCHMIEAMVQFMLGIEIDQPDDDPELIERIARGMCRADGYNPDKVVTAPLSEFVDKAIDLPSVDTEHQAPQWHRYRRGARQFAASLMAMGSKGL